MDCFGAGKMGCVMEHMSLVELKLLAKDKHIKYYYTKSKRELISLLSLPDLPKYLTVQKITIRALREEAKQKQIERIWSKSRQELIEVLYPEFMDLLYPKVQVWNQQDTAHQDEQNQCNTHEHDDPQQHSS